MLLGLRVGRHIDGIVDAYYGPPELKHQVDSEPLTEPRELARLRDQAQGLDDRRRARFLAAQLDGVAATAERLAGEALPYKEEVRRCYRIWPPRSDCRQREATRLQLNLNWALIASPTAL